MSYVLIGLLAGSLITSQHDTREACEGRAVILREQKVLGVKCVEISNLTTGSTMQYLCTGIICTTTTTK